MSLSLLSSRDLLLLKAAFQLILPKALSPCFHNSSLSAAQHSAHSRGVFMAAIASQLRTTEHRKRQDAAGGCRKSHGLGTIVLSATAALVLTLSNVSREIRALAAVGWLIGIATWLTTRKGMVSYSSPFPPICSCGNQVLIFSVHSPPCPATPPCSTVGTPHSRLGSRLPSHWELHQTALSFFSPQDGRT